MTQPTTSPGMIATPHHTASEIGATILREGGNAIDAAIAANAALTVLLPDQTSIGGDCFMMIWPPDASAPVGLNGSGRSPANASANAMREQGHERMPRYGAAAVTVPGTIDAWYAAHERYGQLPMLRLLQPASNLARFGFDVSDRLAAAIRAHAGNIASFPLLASIFLPNGSAPAPGMTLANPALADSLDAIALYGRHEFYEGSIAEQILQTIGGDHGLMTADDLAAHASTWDTPVASAYRRAQVWEMPPNSQGVTALMALAMMEREAPGASWDDPEWLHVQIEAKKRAFAIRDQYFGDPKAMTASVDTMLEADTIEALWRDFAPATATPGQPTLPGDTVYLAVIDGDGLAVSLIQSIFQAFGSGLIAGNSGIVLQNRGTYFNLVPGHPNELAGGKRPLHTLMPGMIDIEGSARGPFGTQGGDAQAQVHMQLVSHLVDFGMTPQDAINSPRWISADGRGSNPFGVTVEASMPESAAAGLSQRGHGVIRADQGWPSAGYAQAVLKDLATGDLSGGADPRAEGSVERT